MKKKLLTIFGLVLAVAMSAFAFTACDADDAVPGEATNTLTVLTWDRGGEGHNDSADNFFTRWIAEQVYEELGIEVTFVAVDRWTEGDLLPAMFAAGTVPDLAMTWSGGLVETFGRQGGIMNLEPLLNEHLDRLTDLNDWVADLLWQNQDPATGEVFSIHQRRASSGLARTGTFIRADWLETLDIPVPTTHEEFIDALRAFRDNADVLGVDNMIPLAMTQDVRWRASTLLESFIDLANMTDHDKWVYHLGGDRFILFPGYVDGVRMLNQMFHEDLIFRDFMLHDGDEETDNMLVAGMVGAYIHNFDMLWRTTPNLMNRLNEIDPDARFIPINPFPNPDTGEVQNIRYAAHGFHVFIPATSQNPVGALEYLNWMSRLENRLFLQTGLEGIHHELTELGGYVLPLVFTTDPTGDHRMYSPNNVDLTLVVGSPPDFGSIEANALAASLGYPGIDPQLIVDSIELALTNAIQTPVITVPGGLPFGNEFEATFNDMASQALIAAITAPPDQFDAVWEAQINGILAAGAQRAIDERRAGLEAME